MFTVQPVGWVGDWHENSAPQWIVVLSGSWWIESMDGTRVEQEPGEFSLGEDQDCAPIDGRKGHRFGTSGEKPAVSLTVQLHRAPSRPAIRPEMEGFEILDPRFRRYVLPNAPLVRDARSRAGLVGHGVLHLQLQTSDRRDRSVWG